MRYFLLLITLIILAIGVSIGYLTLQIKPLPMVMPMVAAKSLPIENLWLPADESGNYPKLGLTAQAALAVDAQTGQILYDVKSSEKMKIASLTKIMTAIVTLENRDWGDRLYVSNRAAEMEPDKMLLIAGETLTVEELMQGLFLVSANDAAEVFAETVTGDRDQFIKLMNQKALSIGMKNSLFVNPSGLEEDNRDYYSSAYDVAVMTRYAIHKWPKLLSITSQPHIQIPATADHQDYDLYSGINLLTTYPGVVGFKTGYTPEAGLTLSSVAMKNGHQIIVVLLGSENRREDAKILLDYAFKKLGS